MLQLPNGKPIDENMLEVAMDKQDLWQSWPVRSFLPWAQISSMNSGEPSAETRARNLPLLDASRRQ